MALLLLAGLVTIDDQLYEAAKVDGANPWQRFRNVTLPGLRPVMLFVTTVTILASANMFGQALLVTNGAPANGTRTAIFYISQVGLRQYRQGAAAAMSYIFAIILVIVSLINFRLFRSNQEKS
jgi:multiple sugar transport system permease protein